MRRDCTNEEQTYTYTNDEGETKEMYVPKADGDASELYSAGIASGINFDKYDDIPVSVTGDNKPSAIKSFTGAGLRPILVENVTKSGYKKPTPVQKNGIPIVMASRDMMACAQVFSLQWTAISFLNCNKWLLMIRLQTGSGKTAAFLLPIIHRLIEADADSAAGPQCIVVTPTRCRVCDVCPRKYFFSSGHYLKRGWRGGGVTFF